MRRDVPTAWCGRRRRTGADLLARIADLSIVVGVALAVVATRELVGGLIPLWDAAIAFGVLALLVSVLAYPDWWGWTGGWGTSPACDGARARRASRVVDVRERHALALARRRGEAAHVRHVHGRLRG